MTTVVREVRDRVDQIVGGLVPAEWSGDSADAFAQLLADRDVRDLLALSEAAGALGALLVQLAMDLRTANRRGEHARELANVAGYELDSRGNLSSSPLQYVDHLVPGMADVAIAARDEMLAARRIAESAWDAARRALATIRVPRIGRIGLRGAESWGFGSAVAPHAPPRADDDAVRTGLLPTTPRGDEYADKQRIDGIRFVQEHCEEIVRVATGYGVSPLAVAGAIVWEAVEDPHKRDDPRAPLWQGPGQGKVHWYEVDKEHWYEGLQRSDAERAENEGELPKPAGPLPEPVQAVFRRQRLVEASGAIQYVAAILADNARIYRDVAKFDITGEAWIGQLLTLYEEGHAEQKARSLAARRQQDPSEVPEMGAGMGGWVVDHVPWIRGQMPCLD